jgi:hypothetical protein
MPNDEGNYRAGRVDMTERLTSRLVVRDDAEDATMDHQPAAGAVVIDKAQLLELVHEMTDSRPGCARPLRQVFLIDSGKDNLGSTFLAKMRQQEENPSQGRFSLELKS